MLQWGFGAAVLLSGAYMLHADLLVGEQPRHDHRSKVNHGIRIIFRCNSACYAGTQRNRYRDLSRDGSRTSGVAGIIGEAGLWLAQELIKLSRQVRSKDKPIVP